MRKSAALVAVEYRHPFVVLVVGRLGRSELRVELDSKQINTLLQLVKQARAEADVEGM